MFFPLHRIIALSIAAAPAIGCQWLPTPAGEPPVVRSDVRGSSFVHVVIESSRPPSPTDARFPDPVFVYFEGDGRPWNDRGTRPSRNPDPRHALAVDLFKLHDGPAFVLGRPCYQGHARDPGCRDEIWTSHRYSPEVADSMVEALRRKMMLQAHRPVVLVGYSGGGPLALFVADRLPEVRAVITIAANLDLAAWTTYHHYLPLSGSLDPLATRSLRPGCEIHIAGDRDSVVPLEHTEDAIRARAGAVLWIEKDADHACCWVQRWPGILARIRLQLVAASCVTDVN